MFPKYTEQNKIGTFFSKLDNLITLYQRKLKLLKYFKKLLTLYKIVTIMNIRKEQKSSLI